MTYTRAGERESILGAHFNRSPGQSVSVVRPTAYKSCLRLSEPTERSHFVGLGG
jgi:hypothetical protein